MFRPICFSLLVLAASALRGAIPPSAAPDRPRGGKFEWARLETNGQYWNRHANGDPALIAYLAKASPLNIDPVWHSVRATTIDALRVYPFIYCDNLTYLSPAEAGNLAEYLRRGGFLLVDACHNNEINRSIPEFLRQHVKFLKALFPNLRMEEMPRTHPIYSIYFKMKDTPPYWKGRDPQYPMHLVFDGERLIGLINLNGFQCGWSDAASPHGPECAQMMTNIYVYAITR
ncbi:MAG: DUF4159 domain-containing protein [Opitutaceae bacterium]